MEKKKLEELLSNFDSAKMIKIVEKETVAEVKKNDE